MIQTGVSLLVAAVADGLNWAPPLLLLLLLYDDNNDDGGMVVFVVVVVVVAVAVERMQINADSCCCWINIGRSDVSCNQGVAIRRCVWKIKKQVS